MLLVALFVLTGTQMGLSVVRDYSKGTVLGEESDSNDNDKKESNWWWNRRRNVSPTTTATPTATPTVTSATSGESSSATPEESAPTATAATSEESPSVPPSEESAPTVTATSEESAPTVTPTQSTSEESAPSAGETVRTILRQIGLPVRVTPTPAPQPEVITVKEEVINERSVGEILKELEATVGTGVQRQARLRFRATDGAVGLVVEVRSGQSYPLATEESAKISDALRQGSGLSVGRAAAELVVNRGTAKAATSLPLLVDLDSNTLMVETSIGIKTVAILPDTAVTRALAAGALTAVNPEQIELVERDDGKIAYRMSGQVGRKLFGFFDIKAEKTVDVSAESGRVLPSLTDSLGATLFNLVAPPAR